MKTKTVLVEDLLKKEQCLERDAIIKRAKDGYYHDFETPVATPKVDLHNHLLAAGYEDLAFKVTQGNYD